MFRNLFGFFRWFVDGCKLPQPCLNKCWNIHAFKKGLDNVSNCHGYG